MNEIPVGYIEGANRMPERADRTKSHLYHGTFGEPGLPMCRHGWNRHNEDRTVWAYSIWRGSRSRNGLCKVCLKRARAGLPGVPAPGGDK